MSDRVPLYWENELRKANKLIADLKDELRDTIGRAMRAEDALELVCPEAYEQFCDHDWNGFIDWYESETTPGAGTGSPTGNNQPTQAKDKHHASTPGTE